MGPAGSGEVTWVVKVMICLGFGDENRQDTWAEMESAEARVWRAQ